MADVGYEVNFSFEPQTTALVMAATPLGNAISKTEFRRLMRELSFRLGLKIALSFIEEPYAQN